MTLMRKLTLNFGHSHTCSLLKVKVLGLEQPKGLIAFGCSPGHNIMPDLIHGAMPNEYAYAPPHIHPCFGASPLVRACPDCKSLNSGNTG